MNQSPAMIRREAKPQCPASQYIAKYLLREGNVVGTPLHFVFPARNAQFLEFYLGERSEVIPAVGEPLRTTPLVTLVGNQSHGRVELFLSGVVRTFTAIFRPTGFYRLFGTPMAEFMGSGFDAQSVLGRGPELLAERLADARSFEQMCSTADAYFSALSQRLSPIVSDRVFERALASAKRTNWTVDALAAEVGLSTRHLERRFVDSVGTSPKRFLRVERLQLALDLRSRRPDWTWGEVAMEAGYFDQTHLVRDFKSLYGASPSNLAPAIEARKLDDQRMARFY